MQHREDDVHGRALTLLDRAQVEHATKGDANAVVTSDQTAALRMSRLHALDLEPALLAAVAEVLLAQTGGEDR